MPEYNTRDVGLSNSMLLDLDTQDEGLSTSTVAILQNAPPFQNYLAGSKLQDIIIISTVYKTVSVRAVLSSHDNKL